VVISAAVLLAVTILVIRFAKNHRYLVTGWFWYLGTLVPVIGIIQVGNFARADRYTYITLTGLFIIVAWGLPELLKKLTSASSVESPQRKIAFGVSMVIVLTALGVCAHRQTSYWKNSFTLFSHANQVTQNNYIAYNNLGIAYNDIGRYPEAIEEFGQAVKIRPHYADAYNNRGAAYDDIGRYPEAIEDFSQAIRIRPDAEVYTNLGIVYRRLGRYAEAIDAYKQAINIKPGLAEAYNNLGFAYSGLSRYAEAIDAYKQAIKIKPDLAIAHKNLGVAYLAIGDKKSALAEYNILKSLNPELANKLLNQINK
jgi:tetratricopeptide (TPR) repeat protein